jgi:replicative DNA helicase
MWNEEGVDIPGLSQRDSNKLTELVNSDLELKAFNDRLIVTGRQGRGWVKPEQYWDVNTIITDLHNLTEGEGRKKFLSAGAMPDIGWVTNTTEYIDSPAMMTRIKQKVMPMVNFSRELSCSSVAFRIMALPFQVELHLQDRFRLQCRSVACTL